jgi:hypothetical protein
MLALRYPLSDWLDDFDNLARYVYPCESGYVPEDYLREIEAYFQKHHSKDAAFRVDRASSMLRFLVANIQSFTVGHIAMLTTQEVEISLGLRYALWVFFGEPDDVEFNPDPDPQQVLEVAEDADSNPAT